MSFVLDLCHIVPLVLNLKSESKNIRGRKHLSFSFIYTICKLEWNTTLTSCLYARTQKTLRPHEHAKLSTLFFFLKEKSFAERKERDKVLKYFLKVDFHNNTATV